MSIDIQPIGDKIGASITGADLSKSLDDATFSAIESAFAQWSVIVFRGQTISPDDQLAFARRFGDLEINAFEKYALEGKSGILKISNIVEDGKPLGYADAGSFWHTDMSYTKTPPRLTMLYALEVPHDDAGNVLGDTWFASAVDAYDALDPETKSLIDGRTAQHFFGNKKRGVKKPVEVTKEQLDKNPAVDHPIARTHPVTGRKALYVTADECDAISGLDAGEALPLIQKLSNHIVRPEFQYHHKWQVGDVLMWDNCAVQHVVHRDYEFPPHRRMMHRVTVNGSVPY